MRAGKHSRFARHLELEVGSKTIAELILCRGRFDSEFLHEFLHRAKENEGLGDASQLAASGPTVQSALKRAAATATLDYRKTLILRRRLLEGREDEYNLESSQRRNLQMLDNGTLLQRTTEAIAAYEHGTVEAFLEGR